MGETSDRAGSDVPYFLDAADTTAPDTALDGGREVQSLSVGRESRTEGPVGSNFIGTELTGSGSPSTGGTLDWTVVQLRDLAEELPVGEIVKDLSYFLRTDGFMVHFPAARDGFLQKESPMANYVFLAVDLKDSQILRLEQSHLVDVVLCTPGSVGRVRKVTKVSDEELRTIVEREISANDIKPGDRVSVDTALGWGCTGLTVGRVWHSSGGVY